MLFLADGFGAVDVDFEEDVELAVVGVVLGVRMLDDADEAGDGGRCPQLLTVRG
jgi:hypothetical protein